MEKKNTYSKWMAVVLACVCGLVSCRAEYEVTKVEGTRVAMDATWDAEPDKDALALLEPYKAGVDSVMGEVKGVAAVSMDRFRPESPLSNLIADVLRQAAASVLGRPADVGLVNVGGIRNVLTEGNITTQNIYEILPFENSLCVLTLGGADLKELCANIAARGGEGGERAEPGHRCRRPPARGEGGRTGHRRGAHLHRGHHRLPGRGQRRHGGPDPRQPAPVSRGSHAPRPFHGLRGARDGCRAEDRGAHRRPCGDEEMNNVNSRKKGLSQ